MFEKLRQSKLFRWAFGASALLATQNAELMAQAPADAAAYHAPHDHSHDHSHDHEQTLTHHDDRPLTVTYYNGEHSHAELSHKLGCNISQQGIHTVDFAFSNAEQQAWDVDELTAGHTSAIEFVHFRSLNDYKATLIPTSPLKETQRPKRVW